MPSKSYKGIYVSRDMTLIERLDFYSMPEPNSGCLLWLASVDDDGYGELRWKGKMRRVNRLTWQAQRGPIPHGLCVCHTCDVPSCRNIDHFFLGTNEENSADRDAKGRLADRRGALNTSAKLTVDQVVAIRSDARVQRRIAEEYGVAPSIICRIKSGGLWGHI